MDRVADFLGQKSIRRAIALVAFVAVLYVFRHLAILLLFFVTFERGLGFLSKQLAKHSGRLSKKQALLVVLLVVAILLAGLTWFGIGKSIRTYTAMQEKFPDKLAELREHPLVARVEDQIGGTEKIVESA